MRLCLVDYRPDMVYGIAWRAWQDIWYGLAGILHGIWYCLARNRKVYCVAWRADMYMGWSSGHGMVWYMVWPGRASYGICIGLASCRMVYVIVWWGMAWYMIWPVGHDTVYRMAWRGMARYMIWLCRHGMVYGMSWRGLAWYMIWPAGHGIWYGLVRYGMVYDISPGGHGMVYGMAWRCMAWHIVWPGGHDMVYDKAWRGMAWYLEMLMWISCFMALPWAIVPFTCGETDVSWRSCSHVQNPLTSRGSVTCIFRSYVQLLFTLGSDSKLRDLAIYHCSGIELSTVTVIVC